MRFKRILPVAVFAILAAFGPVAVSETNTWIGTSQFVWSNADGWSLTHVPLAGEDVAITNRTIVLDAPTEELGSFVITQGTLLFTNWTTALRADRVDIGDGGVLTLPAAFANGAMSNRIHVICQEFLMATGGLINADGRGFLQMNGPGASASVGTISSGGAGHGGIGGISGHGASGGALYNTASNPVIPGSGAGKTTSCYGGNGGGAVRLEATGRMTIHGTITANGSSGTVASNRDGGGGAGGAILLVCETFSGTGGMIRANGALTSALAGGGGGGRIALHYNTALQPLIEKPSVVFQVNPGLNAYAHIDRFRMADWGTLFFSDASSIFTPSNEIAGFSGHLVFPSPLEAFEAESLTLTNAYLGFDENPFTFRITNGVFISPGSGLIGRHANSLSCKDLTNGGIIKLGSNSTVTVGGDFVMTNAEFTLRYDSSLTVSGTWEAAGATAIASLQGTGAGITGRIHFANGADLHALSSPTNGTPGAWGALIRTADDLVLENGSWILPFSDGSNGGSPLFQCASLLIDATSGFNADGRGYNQDLGPGAGAASGTSPSGGGSHGGKGGTASSGAGSGSVYGDSIEPITAGSGGGHTTSAYGGAGGGVIRVEALEHILVNGTLSANGNPGLNFSLREGGGGAGGSIRLTCETFAGTGGIIRANGGRGYGTSTSSGSGAGGRIALQYNPTSQATLERPTVRFEANAGTQTPVARAWLMGDGGTLCFPDAEHVFRLEENMSNFSGYIVIPEGLTNFAPASLTVSDSYLGFDMSPFAFDVAGPLVISTNAGLLSRQPQTLSCASITNLGTIQFGTNTEVNVAGAAVFSNSFSLRADSTLTVGEDLVLKGPASLISIEGAEALVERDLAVQSGVVFSVYAKATNSAPRAWGARVRVNRAFTLDSGAWIHPWSEGINGGAPLFQCLSLSVAENAGINADAKGFAQSRGPGPGLSGNPSSGGGHGGKGGNASSGKTGGSANDMNLAPLLPGSGGGSGTSGIGGTGGGAIRVEAQDAVTLNGTLTANGGAGSPPSAAGRDNGGGAGGSIFVIANTVSGGPQAMLSARGAAATTSSGGTVGAGGGGGGRIAVWTRATPEMVEAAESISNRLIIASSLAAYGGATDVTGGTGWQSGTNGTLSFVTFETRGTLILVH